MTDPSCFVFLNESHEIRKQRDWNHPDRDKLWLYNLHYFDDLNAENAIDRHSWHQHLIGRWIRENSPGMGNGWEPYPISLRVVNWIKWTLAGNRLSYEALHSLAVQIRYLAKRLEIHLLGNHLFANAKALVFAGLFFSGREANQWVDTGLGILSRQIPEQILSDGGHFELSPMYHAIILEDLLDLINAGRAYPAGIPNGWQVFWNRLSKAAERMISWLNVMQHPDGGFPFFNDAVKGIAPVPEDLMDYAERLLGVSVTTPGDGLIHLKNSGYIHVRKNAAMAFLDVGRIGPDYIPGHAHADTLSFELSLFGQRIMVNSGISTYAACPQRQVQRGTAAHNTVEIDGQNSSDVWGSFRVGRRARPFDLETRILQDEMVVACSHDGYRHLPGAPIHRRQWCFATDRIKVTDRINGDFSRAVARYYFHPDVRVMCTGEMEGMICLSTGRIIRWTVQGGIPVVVSSFWHPEFGVGIPNQCLEIVFDRSKVEFGIGVVV